MPGLQSSTHSASGHRVRQPRSQIIENLISNVDPKRLRVWKNVSAAVALPAGSLSSLDQIVVWRSYAVVAEGGQQVGEGGQQVGRFSMPGQR